MTRISIARPVIGEREMQYVEGALRSGWISGRGPYIEKFETRLSQWLNVKHCVVVSSGTAALHLALVALGIDSEHEVIVPAFSMGAIAFAVSYTGAKPVLVDSETSTWNVDPAKVAEKVTNRSRAIIVVHTYGHPADMKPILEVAKDNDIYLIEDAAEAHGAEYYGKKVGTFGDFACFSFFANKIITTGEGGLVASNDEDLAEAARSLRDMAFERNARRKFIHQKIGYNYRMTNLQAALGLAQLEKIDDFIEIRRTNASLYNSLLQNVKGITTPPQQKWAKNVYWMYSILLNENQFGMSRNDLMVRLEREGIETRPFFTPVHKQPVFRDSYRGQNYPVAEALSISGLNLPSGNTLTKKEIGTICKCIGACAAKSSTKDTSLR